jgi:YebC/PmpR family DNA-binding regulatory protein
MSGHNKWSKIKHKKAATDAKKSKVFSKLVKLIQVEAKAANGDTNSPGLRAAIEKARKENMPNDKIERAIKKASEAGDVSAVTFEAYGPGGVGLIIEALTDNNNRTSAEIKHILTKQGTALAGPNAVSWNFTRDKETRDWVPNATMELSDSDLEKLETLVEAIEDHDDVQEVYTNAD